MDLLKYAVISGLTGLPFAVFALQESADDFTATLNLSTTVPFHVERVALKAA
jgi:hypothetical protein